MIYKEFVYQKIVKIVLILSLSLLASCANRGPLPFSFDFLKKSADEDIEKISKIRKQNEILQKNLDIDLYTAIALAIENNKDLKVKLFETALADRQLKDVKFDMLPTMSANAGYSGSDNYQSSTSATVGNNDTAAAKGSTFSTSRNRDVVDQDIGFAWNALDFGLSYIRAGQTGDRFLIAKEIEKKSANNIAKEVIRSYWNALSADKLIQKYDPLIKKVKIALSDSEKIEEMLLQKPMDALLYQKELLDIKRALITQRQTLINSKIELGTLMGLLPNQSYKLVATNQPINILDMDLKNMEKHALVSRAELLENRYQERISVAETKVGLRSLLPNFNINAAFTSSSNDYLQNKDYIVKIFSKEIKMIFNSSSFSEMAPNVFDDYANFIEKFNDVYLYSSNSRTRYDYGGCNAEDGSNIIFQGKDLRLNKKWKKIYSSIEYRINEHTFIGYLG